MEKKKKANQKGREKPRRCSGLTPSLRLLRFPEARRPAPPPQRDPALGLRAGRAPRLCRGKQGLIKLERNFSQLLMNRRLGSRPSPPPRPGPPPSPPRPPSPPLSFLLGLCSGLEGSGLRSEPACGGRAGPSQPGQAASLRAQPSWAPGGGRGGQGSRRARSRVLQRAFSLSLSLSLGGIFFFFLRGGLAASLKLGEREEKMPSPDFSPPLLHPPRSFPKNKKRLELEEVGRKASAGGPRLLPRRRVRGGPTPVALSVGPFVRLKLHN